MECRSLIEPAQLESQKPLKLRDPSLKKLHDEEII